MVPKGPRSEDYGDMRDDWRSLPPARPVGQSHGYFEPNKWKLLARDKDRRERRWRALLFGGRVWLAANVHDRVSHLTES